MHLFIYFIYILFEFMQLYIISYRNVYALGYMLHRVLIYNIEKLFSIEMNY